MNTEQEIFGLISTAKAHQELASSLIAAVERERDELRSQNAMLQERLASIEGLVSKAKTSAQYGAEEGIRLGLQSLGKEATEATNEAAKPVIERMAKAAQAAENAGAELQAGAGSIGGRMVLYACLIAVLLMFSAAAIGYSIGAWTQSEVVALRQERANLEATVANLELRGGRLTIAECGGGKKCVEIDGVIKPFQASDGKYWAFLKIK